MAEDDATRPGIPDEVRDLFEAFLEEAEAEDRLPELDVLLKRHPEHAVAMTRLHEEWAAFADFADDLHEQFGVHESDIEIQGPDSASAAKYVERLKDQRGSSDRYRRRGELGRGGMGIVMRVWDDDLQRDLAMKVLRRKVGEEGPDSSAAPLARFLAEAQITGQLEHPGVVPVHQLGVTEDGEIYFTMTMVRGRDLSDVFDLARKGADGWNQTRAVGVILKVCETLAYAHDKKVVHRDLKPSNVMVGRFGEVYVMDWGLAKAGTADDPGSGTLTSAIIRTLRDPDSKSDASPDWTLDGMVLGTPAYMAPEQAAGRLEQVGARSDVYSVGAMLYELFAGHPPFSSATEDARPRHILRRLMIGPPTPLEQITPDTAPELLAIISKAMARDAVDRYSGMLAMADDLRAYLENRVVATYKSGALIELRKWIARNRRAAGILVATLLISIGSLAALWGLQLRTNAKLQTRATELAAANADAEKARAQAADEAAALSSMVDWMEEMFRLPSPDVARGDVVTARELIDAAAERLNEEAIENPAVLARLSASVGALYAELQVPEEALEHLARAHAAYVEVHGESYPRTLQVRITMGAVLQQAGRIPEATRVFDELEPLVLEASIPVNVRVMYLIDRGACYLTEGRFELGEREFLKALELARRNFDADDLQLITIKNNLGVVYERWDRLDEAEKFFREVYEARVRLQGEDHPDTLICMGSLAVIAKGRGDSEAAKNLYERKLALTRGVFGETNVRTIRSMKELAQTLPQTGEMARGLELLEQAHALAEEHLDEEDRLRWSIRYDLAYQYGNVGRYDEAREIAERELEFRERLLPEDSYELVPTYLQLSHFMMREGQNEEAEDVLRKAVRIQRRRGSNEVTVLVNLLYRLGQVYINLDELGKAELTLGEAQALCDERLPTTHPHRIRNLAQWGSLRFEQEQYEEAEMAFDEAVELALENLPASHSVRHFALHRFAAYLAERENYEEARELLTDLLQNAPKNSAGYGTYQRLWNSIEKR